MNVYHQLFLCVLEYPFVIISYFPFINKIVDSKMIVVVLASPAAIHRGHNGKWFLISGKKDTSATVWASNDRQELPTQA